MNSAFPPVNSMTRFIARASLAALTLAAIGCASTPPAAAPPAVATTVAPPAPAPPADPLSTPPPAGVAADMKFPAISHSRLENGLELRVVTRKTYPIIELRLVLFSASPVMAPSRVWPRSRASC